MLHLLGSLYVSLESDFSLVTFEYVIFITFIVLLLLVDFSVSRNAVYKTCHTVMILNLETEITSYSYQ